MNLRRRELLLLGGVAGAAALGGALVGALVRQSESGVAQLLRSSFPDLTGRSRRLSEWQGQALVLNFWATWCAPCREELPLLEAAQKALGARGLQVVGIAVDSAANVREFVAKMQLSFPVLIGGAGAMDEMRALGNKAGGLPFTVLLDRSGRLRGRKLGSYSAPELEAELAQLLR